ncbi:MAG: GSCFA domain-containing protein [Muribaculaceae bacterium]|nr:GSCFA domain-containing protein [Muribaculaceae bacterium]
MKFRTEYKAEPSRLHLDPTRPIVLVGSCFADNIAGKMRESLWDAFNGLGTLYNPMSIAKVLDLMAFGVVDSNDIESSLFEANGIVHSWLFDSHFSATSKEECKKNIIESRTKLLESFEKSQMLIVTFGTAWCYSLQNINNDEEYIVANCHKMPSSMFSRRRASVEEISKLWIDLCKRLQQKYPDLSIVFTVSPVRHLKDGFEGNTLSKSTLQLAVEQIRTKIENALYFPAYELVCDDLRDYRFYASDLVHPSDSAIEYIWEIFCQTFLDDHGMTMIKEGNKKYKRLNHRPIMRLGN